MNKKYEFNGGIITLPYIYKNEDGNMVCTSSEEYIYAHGGKDYVEPEPTDEEKLTTAKANKIAEIEAYDTSDAVNGFSYNGQQMWIDKSTRVGLVNAANATKALGDTDITVGISGISVTLPIDNLITMLYQLESYALKCYNVTLKHKTDVENLNNIESVVNYDITSDYPTQLEF